jgi:hypothetical protein
MSAQGKYGEHGLTPKQEQFLAALLTNPTIAQASQVAGVSEATARRWLAQPAMQTAYRAARRQSVEQALSVIQAASSMAVAALLRNLKAPSAAIQVRAATTILELGIRAVELADLSERLEALEETLERQPLQRGGRLQHKLA